MAQNVTYTVMILISIIILAWTLFWKGVALWTATKQEQKKWFIFLLICVFPIIIYNTIGIIDLVYLFFFAKKRLTIAEIKTWKKYFKKNTSNK